jgi:ribosomal protein S18 acetylase RimI-like enzyme
MAEDNPTITTIDPPLAPTTATIAENTDIDIPSLTTYQATSPDDLISALRLIADSIAQQRQDASQAVISHPVVLAAMTAVLAIVFRVLYHGQSGDLAVVATTMAGCVMAGLAGVGYVTSGYLELAERTGTWGWLYTSQKGPEDLSKKERHDDDDDDDNDNKPVVLVTKYGEEIIGTVVVHPTSNSNSASPSPSTSKSKSKSKTKPRQFPKRGTTTGTIRAWTVKRRYRNKGIGTGLLEEAVTLCKKNNNNWEGPVFDEHHANSVRLLPGMFLKGRFERREMRAKRLLEEVKRRFS